MVVAGVEIVMLLVLFGMAGVVIGFSLGYLRTLMVRRMRGRNRARANLRHRMSEAQRAIAQLEQTVTAAANDDEEVFVDGVRLSERVARARASQQESGIEPTTIGSTHPGT